jgi:hypothetical protein
MQRNYVGLGAIVLLVAILLLLIFAGRRHPPASEPDSESAVCSGRLTESRSFEKFIQTGAVLFASHEKSMMAMAAAQYSNPHEFLNAKTLAIESGEVSDNLEFAITLAEINGNVCSEPDRKRVLPTIATQMTFILQSLAYIQHDLELISSHVTDPKMKAETMQMRVELENALALLASLNSKVQAENEVALQKWNTMPVENCTLFCV